MTLKTIIQAIRKHIEQKLTTTILLRDNDYPDGLWIGDRCYIYCTSPTNVKIQWFPGDTTKLDQTVYLADPEFFDKIDRILEQWVAGYNEPIPH